MSCVRDLMCWRAAKRRRAGELYAIALELRRIELETADLEHRLTLRHRRYQLVDQAVELEAEARA